MGSDFGFGQRLATKRKAKGLTQADLGVGLATDGDASKSVVYGWEKDQHYPRVDQLKAICDRLGCSADYLVYGIERELPFSAELLAQIGSLESEGITRLENVIRAHMGLSPLAREFIAPTTVDATTNGEVRRTTGSPGEKSSRAILAGLDRVEARNAGRANVGLSKPGRGGQAKGAAATSRKR